MTNILSKYLRKHYFAIVHKNSGEAGEGGLLIDYHWAPIEHYRALFFIFYFSFFYIYKEPKQKLLKSRIWRPSALNYCYKELHLRYCRVSGSTSIYNVWQSNFSLGASNCHAVQFNRDLWEKLSTWSKKLWNNILLEKSMYSY